MSDKVTETPPIHIVVDRDWPEDFNNENGNYSNRCMLCGFDFVGNKGRLVCKYCSYENLRNQNEVDQS